MRTRAENNQTANIEQRKTSKPRVGYLKKSNKFVKPLERLFKKKEGMKYQYQK